MQTVVGIFDMEDNARGAIDELRDMGYDPKNISLIMKDVRRANDLGDETGTRVAGGAVTGAATGAAIGGLAGLLIGVGAIAIPGVGALLIGGPLAAAFGLTGAAATTASGAATGALAGGLIGALLSLGIPENQARKYEERIQAGGILLAVPAFDRRTTEVEDIMTDNGATDVNALDLPEAKEDDWAVTGAHDEEDYESRRYAYRHRRMGRRHQIK